MRKKNVVTQCALYLIEDVFPCQFLASRNSCMRMTTSTSNVLRIDGRSNYRVIIFNLWLAYEREQNTLKWKKKKQARTKINRSNECRDEKQQICFQFDFFRKWPTINDNVFFHLIAFWWFCCHSLPDFVRFLSCTMITFGWSSRSMNSCLTHCIVQRTTEYSLSSIASICNDAA